jgi:hypothetical protein
MRKERRALFAHILCFLVFYRRLSAHLWQLAHGAHAACADVHLALHTINLNAAVLYIEDKAAARAALRMAHIVAMHGFASADITTT